MEINSKRKTVEKGDRELGFPVETLKKSFGAGWRVPHPPDWLLPKVVPRNTPPPLPWLFIPGPQKWAEAPLAVLLNLDPYIAC